MGFRFSKKLSPCVVKFPEPVTVTLAASTVILAGRKPGHTGEGGGLRAVNPYASSVIPPDLEGV